MTKFHLWLAGFRYNLCEYFIEICVLSNNAITENERENQLRVYVNRLKANRIIMILELLFYICIQFLVCRLPLQIFSTFHIKPNIYNIVIFSLHLHFHDTRFFTLSWIPSDKINANNNLVLEHSPSVITEITVFIIVMCWMRRVWKVANSTLSEYLLCSKFSFKKGRRKCWWESELHNPEP